MFGLLIDIFFNNVRARTLINNIINIYIITSISYYLITYKKYHFLLICKMAKNKK